MPRRSPAPSCPCSGLFLRFRLHGDLCWFHTGFFFRALRDLSLLAALGFFTLLLQALHFLLALLECNGHRISLNFRNGSLPRWTNREFYQRGSRGCRADSR